MRLQVDRRVRDEDRVVVPGELPGVRVGLTVQRRLEGDVPARGRRLHQVRVVHQEVRTVHVGHAVDVAVHDVVGVVRPGPRLQRRDHVRELGEQRRVDRGDVAAGDQHVRGVPGGGHTVVHGSPTLAHQRDHLVRSVRVLHGDLASGLVLERGDPVVVRVVRSVLGVPVPRDQLERALALADRAVDLRRGGRRRRSSSSCHTRLRRARAPP